MVSRRKPAAAVAGAGAGAGTARASTKAARSSGAPRRVSTAQLAAAWGVHAYTGLGLPINLIACRLLFAGDFPKFCLLNWLAIFVDATDGTLARAADVKRVIPGFSGVALDNEIDFLTFAFLPALAIFTFDLVPGFALQAAVATMSLYAAGYQFCQTLAKTDDAFVGFPSYWNVVCFYTYLLRPSTAVTVGVYAFCSVLSFVPIKFVYPTRTPTLRGVTMTLSFVWAAAMCVPLLLPSWPYNRELLLGSLSFPAYYVALSMYLNLKRRA
ncbi:hypothetical protein BU14_0075s0039 [Porphyra umbilicalis]|uniref:Phosphatidylcholine synthase n=1 Tax=Porphyra umbilicalis TaxID=2786 RepID=A0A1X6PFC7_PORUM|nr:hypothetical protein BU14_0075s0039 [Porphyra umbilicalis]|eukprot:OSX79549.1 hypothetical protein BU14_0075s0039 [Porphyra umbilicalis]